MTRAAAHTIVVQAGRLLLLRRGPTAPWAPGKWGLPGGYVERGETPAQAAVRELAEEAGIDPPFRMAYIGREPGWPVNHLFLVERPAIYPFLAFPRDGEHDGVAWVTPERLADYDLAPGVFRLLCRAALVEPRIGA